MWASNELGSILISVLTLGDSSRVAEFMIFGGWVIPEMISLAYTWGFCVIYATALKSLTGSIDSTWVKSSIGFTFLGQFAGPAVISLLVWLVTNIILLPFAYLGSRSSLAFILPVAVALSTGNFAGQWLAFWQTHDHVLGISAWYATQQRQALAGTPYQGQWVSAPPAGSGFPPVPTSPTSHPQGQYPAPSESPVMTGNATGETMPWDTRNTNG